MVCWSHFETLPSSDQTISLQTKLYFETTTGFETKAFMYCMGGTAIQLQMLGK